MNKENQGLFSPPPLVEQILLETEPLSLDMEGLETASYCVWLPCPSYMGILRVSRRRQGPKTRVL